MNTMKDLPDDLTELDEFERGEAIYDGTWHADGRLNGMLRKAHDTGCRILTAIYHGIDQDADAVY